MKYIRKAIVVILAAVFIAAVAIGLSVIFAVRNINVFTIAYTDGGAVSAQFSSAVSSLEDALSSYKGRTINAVDEEKVRRAVEESDYAEFVSYEKIYPCTINVTVRERLEVFAVAEEDGYTILDGNCSVITQKSANVNNLDGSPNVLLTDVTAEDYPIVTEIADLLKEKFSSVRAFAESIGIDRASVSVERDSLSIKLRCGLTMVITDYKTSAADKAEALCNAFLKMPDHLKLSGSMRCVAAADGSLSVVLPDGSVS